MHTAWQTPGMGSFCCVGLDSRIGAEMSRFKRLPFVSGSFAYIL